MGISVKGTDRVLPAKEATQLINAGKARLVDLTNIEMISATPSDSPEEAHFRGFRDDFPFPFGPWIQPSTDRFDQRLTPKTLREIHRKSSVVRPCVSFIVRTLSTTPWSVVSQGGSKRNLDYATELFIKPGPGAKTFRVLLAKVLTDLFVLDSIYVEKIRARGSGGLVEFAPRDPATFRIIPGDDGDVLGYQQQILDEKGMPVDTVDFDPDDIMHTVFYPRTDSFLGTPVIEAIVDEVAALILASQGIASFFDEDEIPTGLLHLGDIGQTAYERAKIEFESKGGLQSKRMLRTTYGRSEPRWIPFQRPFREMEISQLMPRIERIVFRNFGITPLDQGMSQDVNRSTAESFKEIRTFTLIKPILDMLAESFTFDILHEIDPHLFLEFQHFSRTGEPSDAEGGGGGGTGEGFGTENVPVDTDIPGEGTGEGEDRSPLFGGYGLRAAGFRPIICRPAVLPYYRKKKFHPDQLTDTQIIEYLASDNLRGRIRESIDSSEELVSTLLSELAEEVNDMVESKATPSEIRTLAEYSRDDVIKHCRNIFRTVESESFEYIARTTGQYPPHYEVVSDVSERLKREINEIIVDQISASTLPADEEAAFIAAFDVKKIDVRSLVTKAAVAPFRSAFRHRK